MQINVRLYGISQHLLILPEDALGSQPSRELFGLRLVLEIEGGAVSIHVVETFFGAEAHGTRIVFGSVELVEELFLGVNIWHVSIYTRVFSNWFGFMAD
jgi:hypothetical protein